MESYRVYQGKKLCYGKLSYFSGNRSDSSKQSTKLSFDAALNYLKGADASAVLGVKVSEDYTGDYATATWEDVEVPNWPAGNSWDMVNTGGIDLSEFKGKKIHFALKYTSTDKGGTTWEMKNFLVEEKKMIIGMYLSIKKFWTMTL